MAAYKLINHNDIFAYLAVSYYNICLDFIDEGPSIQNP